MKQNFRLFYTFIFFILFFSISFGGTLERLEQENLRQEQIAEQERLQKEYLQREKELQNYKILEDTTVTNELENSEIKFYIKTIIIADEEKILSENERDNILEKYLNKELGSSDITKLLSQLTNILISKGYITSLVTIEDNNDLTTGVLNLKVAYGKIDKIVLNDEKTLDKAKKFFLVNVKEGEILNIRKLDTTTENFNYLEANNVVIDVIPSEKIGYSDIVIKNDMNDKFTLSLFTNNHGEDRQNGRWRYGTSLNIDSPLGIGDKLFFSYTTTHKKNPNRNWKYSPDVLEPGEILPIGPVGYDPSKGDTLPYKRIMNIFNLQYTLKYKDYTLQLGSSKSIKESSFYTANTVYDFKSSSHTLSANLDKIVWRNQKSKISLGVGIKRKHNDNHLERTTLSDRILTIGDISINGNTIVKQGVLGMSFDYERGIGAFHSESDADKIASTPKARFHKYTFNTNYYKPFDNKLAYRFNLNISNTNDVLYGSEKHCIGGVGSVGGYHRTGTLQGDKGIDFENEISYKILNSQKFGTLTPYISHSYGVIRNNEDFSRYRKGHMSGITLGIRYNMRYLNFDVAYARALNYSSYLSPNDGEIYFNAGIKLKF